MDCMPRIASAAFKLRALVASDDKDFGKAEFSDTTVTGSFVPNAPASTTPCSPLPAPCYTESDPTDPVTVYGKTMVAAEQLILAGDANACILRISLPMGISLSGHAGAIDWIQSRFKKSKPATLYIDEIRTPTYTDCLTELCEVVLASEMRGVYHAGGPRRLSLYNIAQIINRVGGYDPKLLLGCPRKMAGPIPPRAGNVSLNSDKLSATLGFDPFDPWPLPDEFTPTHREWHHERIGFRGSNNLLAEVLHRNPAKAVR
jgi:dTDP-4-dehydrorhamnose reductase